jgi:PhnB protein
MAQLNPYLNFNDNCLEAMNFYKDCLGGELTVVTVGESAMADQMPPQLKDAVLHATLKNGEAVIMASDMRRGELTDGNTVQLCMVCKTEDEINAYFSRLSTGGKITQPLNDMPWGSRLGTLTDKFGKLWMLEYDKNQTN